jgi:DNA adenine methylase
MNFWTVLKENPKGLEEELGKMPRENWKSSYAGLRTEFNQSRMEGPRMAALLIWLNRAGFNGLYRENKSGIYNVPPGDYNILVFPNGPELRAVSQALVGVELRRSHFRHVLAEALGGDQIYADPPYIPKSTSASFTAYSSDGFTLTDQTLLAQTARSLAWRGVEVVLSNHDVPLARELYSPDKGFEIVPLQVKRSISCKGAGRDPAGEILVRIGPDTILGANQPSPLDFDFDKP